MKNTLYVISLALLTFASFAGASELNSYHYNQVQQVEGQVYYVYEPAENARMREQPSFDGNIVGLLNLNDRDHPTDRDWRNYKYTRHNSDWMLVSQLGGESVGYSHSSLFTKQTILQYTGKVEASNGTYELDFLGYPYSNIGTYGKNNYWYKVTLNGELLVENGWNLRFEGISRRMEKQEDAFLPAQIHELLIQEKNIGWLFGWNRFNDATFHQGLEFSFARVIVPTLDSMYNQSHHGLKFSEIADLLDKKYNQLVITPTQIQDTIHSIPHRGYYYTPYQVTFWSNDSGTQARESSFKVSDALVRLNPFYAYAIAVNTNDHTGMRKSSDNFLAVLKDAEQACSEYEFLVEEVCPECKTTKSFNPVSYLENNGSPLSSNYNQIKRCLLSALPNDAVYHLFSRTGLFPSEKVINDYISNQYRYTN